MFRSKSRPIVIPHSEHARFAGILASFWGNDKFGKPPIDFDAFVEGVCFHDWAYGEVDNFPLGEITKDDWHAIVEKGIELSFDNPVTDIVVNLHLKRLISKESFPEKLHFISRIDSMVSTRILETPFTLEDFLWADRITQFCDSLAFNFSFEVEAEETIPVCTESDSHKRTLISYHVLPNGNVTVSPWPFSRPEFTGFIYAFEEKGYPETLSPIIKPFAVSQTHNNLRD